MCSGSMDEAEDEEINREIYRSKESWRAGLPE
jgi:hypothetical protein